MTRYLSEGTTDYTSDVSVRGTLDVVGASTLAGTLAVTGATTLTGLPSLTSITQLTAVLTASASSSIDTTFAMTGATVGDGIIVAAPSAVSGDLSWSAFVPSADNITLRLSNVSTVDNVQTAQTWTFYRLNAIV